MSGIARIPWSLIGRVYVLTVTVTLLVAAATAVVFPGTARSLLAFSFGHVPGTLREAGLVLLHNARLLLVPIGGAAVVGVRRESSTHALRVTTDMIVGVAALANVGIVGVGIGAYGLRMVRSILPHGPFELAAFAAGMALYVSARRGELTRRSAVMLVVVALAALTIAAPLEVFVTA